MIKLKYPLYEHQKRAYDKLKNLKVGSLNMDMGTGKTRTTLEIIKDKYNSGKIDKVIWFCPCSAKINIKKDMEKHIIEGKEAFIIVGIESVSSSIALNSFLYEFVRKYRVFMVVDESTKIKNIDTKRSKRIIDLGIECKYRFILTGNPIPKNELDLFGQFYFLDWRILGYKSQWSFNRKHAVFHDEVYTRIVDTKNTDYLAKRIAPFSYRVKKDECLDLPKKIYDTRYFNMGDLEWEDYYIYSDYLLSLVNDWKPETIYRLFNILQGITAGFIYNMTDKGYIYKTGYKDTPETNHRLKAFMDIIEEFEGKVIVYCQYQIEAKTIVDLLNKNFGENSAVLFDGTINTKQRNINIERFRNESRFLVANKACAGFSLNLQFCNQIIYYNNDWDYGTREQSEDRINRIGQKHKCYYLDIICAGTVEEYIMDCLSKKEALGNRFLKELKGNQDKDMKELLKEKIMPKKKQAPNYNLYEILDKEE